MAQQTQNSSTGRRIGVVAGGVVLAIAAVVLYNANHDPAESCALGSAGAIAIYEGLAHRTDAARIMAEAGVPVACNEVVKTLVDSPSSQVELNVDGTSVSGSGYTFTSPAPSPASTVPPNALACILKYGRSTLLVDLCESGSLAP